MFFAKGVWCFRPLPSLGNGVRPVRFAGLLGLLSTVAVLYSLLVGGLIEGTLKDRRLDLDLSRLKSLAELGFRRSVSGPKASSM